MEKFLNVGYDNNVNLSKVVAVLSSNSAPSKRVIKIARESQLYLDATEGNKTSSIIVMENGHVIASAVMPKTLINRLDKNRNIEK